MTAQNTSYYILYDILYIYFYRGTHTSSPQRWCLTATHRGQRAISEVFFTVIMTIIIIIMIIITIVGRMGRAYYKKVIIIAMMIF